MSETNRLVKFMQDVVKGVFADFRYLYPKSSEYDRDLTRLLTQLGSRGAAMLTDDFPSVAKHLNQCLDSGQYTNPHMVLSRPKRSGEEIPKFMREIYLLIFESNGRLRENPSSDAVLFLKNILSQWKSIRLPCKKDAIENEVENFFSLDASLDPPTLGWSDDDLGLERYPNQASLSGELNFKSLAVLSEGGQWRRHGVTISDKERRNIELTFDIVASSFGLAPTVFTQHGADSDCFPKHGPGVVANLSRGDTKYRFPFWADKLQRFFPRDFYALPSFGGGFSSDRDDFEYSKLEYPSRVIAVPKTLRKPRLIAAEPVEHQWIQQLLWRSLEANLRTTPISRCVRFRRQDLNMDLARKGSRDGSITTIDLSEASDRLTCHTVERFWRVNHSWLSALHACRTRRASYEYRGSHTRFATLRKFGPMGSACTFPVQSVIYASLVVAAILSDLGRKPSIAEISRISHMVQVFGDDIITPTPNAGTTIRFLRYLGLKVNDAKTFTGKNFRESCGIEAFQGDCVTPTKMLSFPTGRPGTIASLVETSNNLHKKGLWNTAMCIRGYLEKWNHMIPIERDESFGISYYSFLGSDRSHLSKRTHVDYQQIMYRVLKQDVRMKRHEMTPSQRLLQYFIEKPSPLTKWESGTAEDVVVVTRPGWALA